MGYLTAVNFAACNFHQFFKIANIVKISCFTCNRVLTCSKTELLLSTFLFDGFFLQQVQHDPFLHTRQITNMMTRTNTTPPAAPAIIAIVWGDITLG